LVAGWATFYAVDHAYLAQDVGLAYASLTAAGWFIFLLSLAVAVMVSTDRDGRLHLPRSLGPMLCWILLVPLGGLAIGRLVNYPSSLEITVAVSKSPGAEVVVMGDGVSVLDGEIGFKTYASLPKANEQDRIRLLRLRSWGGFLDVAIDMGSFVSENAIAIHVDEYCESACVIVALSGSELYVSPYARFGFHRGSAAASPHSQTGRFLAASGTDELLSRLHRLGVPDAILRQAEETSPDEMYYVSGEDMYRAGLAQHLVD
jgi:hypothetical protein